MTHDCGRSATFEALATVEQLGVATSISGISREWTELIRPLEINKDNLQSLVNLAPKTLKERKRKFLQAILRRYPRYNNHCYFMPKNDYALAHVGSLDECKFVIQSAADEKLINLVGYEGEREVLPPISHYEVVLMTARKLIDANEFSVAVVVAHMACEVKVAGLLADSFRAKGLTQLEEAVLKLLPGYNLGNNRVKSIYNAITGDEIQKQPFWPEFNESAERRNRIVHNGAVIGKVDAEASLGVARKLVDYLS